MIDNTTPLGTPIWVLTRKRSQDVDDMCLRMLLAFGKDTVFTTTEMCCLEEPEDCFLAMCDETVLQNECHVSAYPITDCYADRNAAFAAAEKEGNHKYEFTGEERKTTDGVTLHRIRAITDFAGVEAGDLGGWIEHEDNLAFHGNAWVADDAMVFGDACIYDNAYIGDSAVIYGHAEICGDAEVSDDAVVFGDACICEEASVYGHAVIGEDAIISGSAVISGSCSIMGRAEVTEYAHVNGHARVYGKALVDALSEIGGYTVESGKPCPTVLCTLISELHL